MKQWNVSEISTEGMKWIHNLQDSLGLDINSTMHRTGPRGSMNCSFAIPWHSSPFFARFHFSFGFSMMISDRSDQPTNGYLFRASQHEPNTQTNSHALTDLIDHKAIFEIIFHNPIQLIGMLSFWICIGHTHTHTHTVTYTQCNQTTSLIFIPCGYCSMSNMHVMQCHIQHSTITTSIIKLDWTMDKRPQQQQRRKKGQLDFQSQQQWPATKTDKKERDKKCETKNRFFFFGINSCDSFSVMHFPSLDNWAPRPPRCVCGIEILLCARCWCIDHIQDCRVCWIWAFGLCMRRRRAIWCPNEIAWHSDRRPNRGCVFPLVPVESRDKTEMAYITHSDGDRPEPHSDARNRKKNHPQWMKEALSSTWNNINGIVYLSLA